MKFIQRNFQSFGRPTHSERRAGDDPGV